MSLELLERSRGSLRKRLWRQVAFLGRYANQPADVCLAMPVDDLARMVAETSKLLEDENEATRRD
jgi:ligand-binding sensor domain-containing protein